MRLVEHERSRGKTQEKRVGAALYAAESPIALRVLTTRKSERAGPALWRPLCGTDWFEDEVGFS